MKERIIKFMDDTEIIDYGFSLMTEEEVKKAETELLEKKTSGLSDVQKKLLGIKKIIWPFLEHLKSDSEKLYVFWPQRANKVEELQRKIENYLETK